MPLAGSAERLIWCLGLDVNMQPRSFTAFCQTVTAACGKIAPRGVRKKKCLCVLLRKQVGVCAEGGWGGDSLRQCEKEILPDRHRVRYNTTEPCFQCQAFRVCRFLLAIINGFYYAIHNPLHRQAGWLAGWRSCQQSQCLPPLFKPVTPCFQIFSDYANFHITMVPSRASEHTF